MCGIAGILGFDGRPAQREAIQAMTDAIAHRGRDSVGFAIGGKDGISTPSLALGHRRLSVIDLSGEAAQPMFSADRRLCLVYNGELYNYRQLRTELQRIGTHFRTNSDTEVILAAYSAWGRECLKHFNGMFAFALWDESRHTLFCARDALGIKPFYYRLDREGFCFSSESRALSGKGLEPQAVAAYFFTMYVPRELSIHAGVRKLLPGSWLEVTPDGKFSQQQWWHLPTMAVENIGSEEAAIRLLDTLDRAVALQLQSDVPVGALLSGGFDSGMIVASAAQQTACLHTYSVGFDDVRQFNELDIAAGLANRYGTSHHAYVLRSADVIGVLDKALSVMTEPVADSAVVPSWFLAQRAAEDGVKVLLSGTGGDEVFGGYTRYVASTRHRKILYQLPVKARQLLSNLLPMANLTGARMRHPSLDMSINTGGSPRLTSALFSSSEKFGYFLEQVALHLYPEPVADAPLLYKHMAYDLQVYLPDLLLLILDQLCMAHTVEGRVPLLDVELIAQSYALQPKLHADPRQATTRKLMRRMARGRLDERTFNAPKQGFSGPVRSWIADNEPLFRERTYALTEIPGLEMIQPKLWWSVPAERRTGPWAHDVFLMYCFSTWFQANARP
jgi:asparagine synthase (glutamine-hydrolysing)